MRWVAAQNSTGPWAAMLPDTPKKAVTAGRARKAWWEKKRCRPPSTPSAVSRYIPASSPKSSQVNPVAADQATAATKPRAGTPTVR